MGSTSNKVAINKEALKDQIAKYCLTHQVQKEQLYLAFRAYIAKTDKSAHGSRIPDDYEINNGQPDFLKKALHTGRATRESLALLEGFFDLPSGTLREAAPPAAKPNGEPSLTQWFETLKTHPEWNSIRPVLCNSEPIPLDAIYSDLHLVPEHRQQLTGLSETHEMTLGLDLHSRTFSVDTILARTVSRTVVAGAPGAGKTTLIKWVCQQLLKAKEPTIPIVIRLRDYAHVLRATPHYSLIEHFLASTADVSREDMPAAITMLTQCLNKAGSAEVMFLLDGWDEVPVDLRQRVKLAIDQETINTKTIITSRPSGFPALLRRGDSLAFEIGRLSEISIRTLCLALTAERGQPQLGGALLELIEWRPSLASIVANPYLLTLFCEIIVAHRSLPQRQIVTPAWLLREAIALMFSDHNAYFSEAPLHQHELERLEALAYQLSFDETGKRVQFNPSECTTDSGVPFIDSALAKSRYLNAAGPSARYFEFSHLRLQEFFAAQNVLKTPRHLSSFIDNRILSLVWHEESAFLSASLAASPQAKEFWTALANEVKAPDLAKEVWRRSARILAAAGAGDGGLSRIGVDLREKLTAAALTETHFLEENVCAMLVLDAEFFLSRLAETLANGLHIPETHLESIYKLIPHGQRRSSGIDGVLRKSSTLSWMLGLSSRAFQGTINTSKLISTIESESASVDDRIAAMRDLGVLRVAASVEPLSRLLGHANDDLSVAAIETLGKIGNQQASLVLSRRLADMKEERPSQVAALLNALSLDGYAAMTVQSRDLILSVLESKCDFSFWGTGLLISVLTGVALPTIPNWLIKGIQFKGADAKKINQDVAALLAGVRDENVIEAALCIAIEKANRELRCCVYKSAPYIPISSNILRRLLGAVSGSLLNTSEHVILIRLLARTVRRFPNAEETLPISLHFRNVLEAIVRRENVTSAAEVVNIADIVGDTELAIQLLVQLACDQKAAAPLRGQAVTKLAEFTANPAALDRLKNDFPKLIDGGIITANVPIELVTSWVCTVICWSPPLAPWLLKIAACLPTHLPAIQHTAAKTALERGFIVYADEVIGADGKRAFT